MANEHQRLFHPQHAALAECTVRSLEETDRLAAALHRVLPPRACLGLVGTLGAGKTRLVQAFAAQASVPSEAITSPTFTLVQHYVADRELYHIDAYRIADADEFWELGIDELLEEQAITLIEWADRFPEGLPSGVLWVRIGLCEDGSRRVQFSGLPSRWGETVATIVADFEASSRGASS